MTISRRHAKNKITMRDQFNLWPSRSYQIFIFNLRSTLSCKYEHEGEDKLKIRIDTRVSGWIDFRPGRIWRNFSFPVHSLLLKGGSKGTFLDMLREKLRLMMLRDVTTFSTSSLVLSAPCLLLLLPPPRKYDNRGSRWTTLISPISNYPLLPCVLYPRWYLSPFSNICSE